MRESLLANSHFLLLLNAGRDQWDLRKGTTERVAGLQIAFTGVIANVHDLKQRLMLSGHVSLGEILAAAYHKWGYTLAEHVEGQYAAAVLDAKTGVLALVQDYLGLLPLQVKPHGDFVAVSSTLSDLAKSDDVLDKNYAAIYFANGIVEGNMTPFREIQRVGLGQAGTVDLYSLRLRFHQLAPLVESPPRDNIRLSSLTEELRGLLLGAVNAFSCDAKHLGCEVSGGLDSGTVATMAIRGKAVPIAFTKILTARNNRDIGWARHIAASLELEHEIVDGDCYPPFSVELDRQLPEPGDWAIDAAMTMAYRECLFSRQIDVLLTGQGGDAVLMGDQPGQYHLADKLARFQFGRLFKDIRDLQARPETQRPLRYWLTSYGLAPLVRQFRRQRVEGFLHETELPSWVPQKLIQETDLLERRVNAVVPFLPTLAQTAMAERISAVVSALTRHSFYPHYGIQVRHPLLHLPLVKFMLKVPASFKSGDFGDRHLHRISMISEAPKGLMHRHDKGGGGGIFLKVLSGKSDQIRLMAEDSILASEGLVDPSAWGRMLASAAAGQLENFSQFAAGACYEMWLRRWRA
jgi:asparagine synthetase B (glutamine-hydrolysing)